MEITYSAFDLLLCLLLYSFLGWGIEVCCIAIKERHFVNRGFLNLPVALPYGIAAAILLVVLPTMDRNIPLQYLMTWIVICLVWSISDQFIRGVSRKSATVHKFEALPTKKLFPVTLVLALAYMLMYLIVHPVILAFLLLLPDGLVKVLVLLAALLVTADFFGVLHALRTNTPSKHGAERKAGTQRLGDRITDTIWRRLQKAYPGIQEAGSAAEHYTFANGICFDKLVWVFLVSSFLGALIEMAYCYAIGGVWMNRSSLLYGSFSVVWGFGAVILTVTLQRLAEKSDRAVFLAGFVIGGAYEYLCSVLTELVFGTVFWDYSGMPLNIGGRTNVMYCIFWGLLSVVWIKILYPLMSKGIEKLPPLPGKVATWVIVLVMACDGLLTAASMVRYTERQTTPQPQNIIEEYLDFWYDDGWMERRWPNMFIPETT